jgi:ATP/maltotriose-dependent transcriptional regulator MalT
MTRYVDEILHACAPSSPVAREEIALPLAALDAQSRLASPLTAREIEVLYLLDRRYSDKEIAQALVISSFTVHAHTHSIFRKLDVNDRREAALKARSIGLLQQTSASTQI